MPTYLLTGIAGFIASRVARRLLEAGHQVIGIDNLNDAYDARLKYHRIEALRASFPDQAQLRFVRGDIEDKATLQSLFATAPKFDAILNLAARAGVRYSMIDPDVYLQTNAQGTLNLLELMRKTAVNKMVLASTSSLYAGHPLPFSEDMPVNAPISPYAASKKAAELLAHAHYHLYGLDVSIVRYFTVYGPAGRPDMCIFRFIRWIDEGQPIELFGDGTQSRDFTYVDDIADGTIRAIRPVGYQIINLGGGKEPVDLLTVIHMIEERLGKKAALTFQPMHKADIKETRADVGKAFSLLHWAPSTPLASGLDACIDWYLQHRAWANEVPLP